LNTLVLKTTDQGEFPIDVYQKLANDRILFICDLITDQLASDIVASLLLKDAEEPGSKITLFINSTGGDIRNIFMIYDIMKMIESPIQTVCIGAAMNEAVLLLAAGTPGMRFATKNCRLAVSQLINDYILDSNLTDAKKMLDLSVQDNKRMMDILAKCTGKTSKQLMQDFDRRVFMAAPQAVKYGLIDKVVKVSKDNK
jgi:ATP-dependent Clp protease, protease subunit